MSYGHSIVGQLVLNHRISIINPFTLKITLESIICYSHTFKNNLEKSKGSTKYLKESCCFDFDQYFSFECFPENTSVSKIFPKRQACFGCSEFQWVTINEPYDKSYSRAQHQG